MSSTTPEGKVKAQIKEYLDEIGAYHFWPVQMGMGARTLDCLVCLNGRFMGIEVKRPGVMEPKPFQALIIRKIGEAKGVAFTTDSFERAKKFIDDFGLGLYDPEGELDIHGVKKRIYDILCRFPEGIYGARLREILYMGREETPGHNTLSVQITQLRKLLAPHGKKIECRHWGHNDEGGLYRLVNVARQSA